MTREEANKVLRSLYNVQRLDTLTQEEMTAVAMAISSLSAEACDDCISRKEVQDYIAKYLSQYLYDDIRSAVETIDAYIGDMPNVQPIRPKGEWINTRPPEMSDNIVCSLCGFDSIADYKFCPNCGADMRGE